MKNYVTKAILIIFILLIYSCNNEDKNITEMPHVGYYADYLTISSIYKGADISPRLRTRILDVHAGEIISQTTRELPNLDNNIVQVIEDIRPSMFTLLGKNTLQEDNILRAPLKTTIFPVII